MNPILRFHFVLGLLALLAFLASGAYMRFVAHPATLEVSAHDRLVSRHIYVLANALVHLALGAYATPRATRAGRAVQWTASLLLAGSSVLLLAAFVIEGAGNQPRGVTSTFGLYSLFAGVILHFAAALRSAHRAPGP